eukprot:scaffold3680_cov146-Amphora_coffeaeformis.AAC.1
MDLPGSASQAMEAIMDEQLSLMELTILTPEEWESDYGIKPDKKMARRMAAFHHWVANPDPNYPTSNYRRLADMDRNKFENYMMTEWRKPKAPPQSQDPQVAESAGSQPDVVGGNQPTMAASFQAATRQTGTQVAGTINIPPPAGPQSRRASLAESRRKSKIGTQSGLTPRKNVTFNVGGLPPTQTNRQGTFSKGSNLFGTQTGTSTPQGTNPRS